MIYKEFLADAAKGIMAAQLRGIDLGAEFTDEETAHVAEIAKGSVAAAKFLADALEEGFKEEDVDGGLRRYAENETFFDNYVNWTKTK